MFTVPSAASISPKTLSLLDLTLQLRPVARMTSTVGALPSALAVAALISAAPTDEEGRSVGEKYGVAVGDTRALPLEDGRAASLTVVGIRTDDLQGLRVRM